MLCKCLQETYTWDCRRLHPGDIIDYPDDRPRNEKVFQALTERETMRFYARASDEVLDRLENTGGIDFEQGKRKPSVPEPDKPVTLMSTDREGVILQALQQMDHKDDEQWTSSGLPLMDVICELAGDDTITRAELMVAAPDYRRRK